MKCANCGKACAYIRQQRGEVICPSCGHIVPYIPKTRKRNKKELSK